MAQWNCPECGSEFDRLFFYWRSSSGSNADIDKYSCPYCPCDTPVFRDTEDALFQYINTELDRAKEFALGFSQGITQ